MKNLFLGMIASAALVLTSCNGKTEKKTESTDATTVESVEHHTASNGQGNFSELYAHYQHLTFALSSDNDKEAANAAKGILEVLPKIKTDEFTGEEKSTYEDISADIQEHAEHISDNEGNIVHQREHLVMLSKDFYDIAKTFGTEKTLYKVFCPMYDNNKGAYWLSDSKEIKTHILAHQCSLVAEFRKN